MTSKKLLSKATCREDGLQAITKLIHSHLIERPIFCLWLHGELGAGKTSLSRELLRVFGLPLDQPVQSPTFSILNEYCIGERTFAHIDLYRICDPSELDELGLTADRNFSGLIVEWPERALDSPLIKSTHSVTIEKSADLLSRSYSLFSHN